MWVIVIHGGKWNGESGNMKDVLCITWLFGLPKKSNSSGAAISGSENRSVGLPLPLPMIAGGNSKLKAGFRDFRNVSKQETSSKLSGGDVATYMEEGGGVSENLGTIFILL